MLLLSFVWLYVLVAELVNGANAVLRTIVAVIWILFIFYFAIRLLTVANRWTFLKKNWLFILAILVSVLLFLPALRPFRAVHAIAATFGMQAVWIFASADQGMRSLRRTLGRRGVGYALTFTLVVITTGAAGMLYFERNSPGAVSFQTYPDALWWTAMQMTNIGSAYSPLTTGGRILCLGISVYAAAMFGYLTALIATLFIDREIKESKTDLSNQKSFLEVKTELIQLRLMIEALTKKHFAGPTIIHEAPKDPKHIPKST